MKDFQGVMESNGLLKAGRFYDLHNCYEFSGIYVGGNRCARLYFEPHIEWGRNEVPVALVFHDVEFLQVSSGLGVNAILDLDEVGYKEPGEEDDSWLDTEEQSSDAYHLFFRLTNNEFIRIYSKRACLWEIAW